MPDLKEALHWLKELNQVVSSDHNFHCCNRSQASYLYCAGEQFRWGPTGVPGRAGVKGLCLSGSPARSLR